MIRLYIEDKLVELTDDIIINQTYETLDPDKLSSIKNSFSKTVDIPGTRENNILFGDIFRIDRYIPSGLKGDIHGRIYNRDYQYDPHKKASYMLFKNGAVVNRGYCTLDNIVVKPDNSVTYKITLYGGIGEFFYSLAYNEDGSPKTLFDMHWGWRTRDLSTGTYGEPLDEIHEDIDILMECSAKNVNMSYHLLEPRETIYWDGDTWEHWGEPGWWKDDQTAYYITDIDKDVVLVPCYTGTYEDFDSKKMLVSTFNQNYNPGIGYNVMTQETKNLLKKSFPDQITDYSDDPDNPKTYSTMDKNLSTTGAYRYGIASFSRDLDPWEAGDIRVNEMPVAIRLSKLMKTLSEPYNNGGYDVVWNQSILNSPYWNYSWVMLGKIEQEKEEIPEAAMLTLPTYTYQTELAITPQGAGTFDGSFISSAAVIEREYTVTGWNIPDNPYFIFKQDFNIDVQTLTSSDDGKIRSSNFYQYVKKHWVDNWQDHAHSGYWFYDKVDYRYVDNYIAFITSVYDGNVLKKEILDVYWFTTDSAASPIIREYGHIINKVNNTFGTSFDSDSTYIHILTGSFDRPSVKYIYNDDYISVKVDSNIQNLRITQKQFNCFQVYRKTVRDNVTTLNIVDTGIYGYESPSLYGPVAPYDLYADGDLKTTYNAFFTRISDNQWYYLLGDNMHNIFYVNIKKSSIILPDNNSGFSTLKIDKSKLFSNSKSPFKYLSDLVKMMNWKITADNIAKKIYIEPLNEYYSMNRIIDINDKVDLSRDISIKNLLTSSKRINVGLGNLDTYPITLFNRKNVEKFNLYRYDTGIEFNIGETNLLDNLIYKSELDWQQSSVFYNLFPQFPKAYNTPTISWTLFNTDEFDPEQGSESIDRYEKIVPGCPSNQTSLTASNDWLPKISLFDKDNKYVEPDTVLIFLNGFVANYDYVNVDTSAYAVAPRISLSEDTYEQFYFCGGRCYVYDFKYNDAMASWGMYSSDQKGTAFSCALPFFTRELYNLYESDVLTETVTLQPTNVWNNQYFSYENNVYTVTGDTNWEMRSYAIDLNTMSNLKFTAHYPADQTGQVLMKWTNYGGAIGAEGTIGPAQHDFVDAAINVSNDLAFIYMNVWKGNAETTYITADVQTTLPPEWRFKNEIVASWNLVGQSNILDMYNLNNVRFLKDPSIVFQKRLNEQQKEVIDENEYTASLPSLTNSVFDSNWRGYLGDLYDRNARDVTVYIDLSGMSDPNQIMRTIFYWQGFYWIPMKLENFKMSDLGQDKFTKCTIHKIADLGNWTKE